MDIPECITLIFDPGSMLVVSTLLFLSTHTVEPIGTIRWI
jgi:hypothetical protein